jgi:hypothetical protein
LNNQALANSAAMGIAPRQWSKQQLKSANGEYPTPYIDHWILQLHGIAPERINDPDVLMQELTRLVEPCQRPHTLFSSRRQRRHHSLRVPPFRSHLA